jgi:outer membrane protein OmpA-like peptidoglycan-associated protein
VRTLSLLCCVLLGAWAILCPAPATAQMDWVRVSLTGAAGYATFDDSFQLDDGIPFEGRFGLSFFRYVGIEGTYGKVLATSKLDPDRDFPLDHWGADLVLNILPNRSINPYVLGGYGQLNLDQPTQRIDMQGWEYGGGLKIALARMTSTRIDLRLEAREIMVENKAPLAEAGDNTNHFFATAGIHVELFGHENREAWEANQDDDKDGVPNSADLCPQTPAAAQVDARGCPFDADNDGVLSGLDKCEGTPEGAVVDASGCPKDQDNDGVPDGLDACANTPAGTAVDASGCPRDSDGDGVLDGYDKCEGTPKGVKVDEHGCPLPESKMEQQLVQTGVISLDNIYFDSGTARLKPESFEVLNTVADVLERWPNLKFEIGGHADSQGPDDYNLELSRKRAHAVLEYLLEHDPNLHFEQFFVKGYGESQPVASNATAAGRAQNRRVEFKVLNREVLQK